MSAAVPILLCLASVLVGCGTTSQPSQSNIRELLAAGQYARDQHSDALCIQSFTEVLHQQPDVVLAYVGRASCYLDEGNAAPAVQDYSAAIRLSPNDPDLYYGRASAEQQIGNYSSAHVDFQRSASVSTANPGQIVRSAEGLGQMGFYQDAESALDAGIKRYPDFWDLHRYRAELQGQLGADADALLEFEKAIQLSNGSDLAFVLDTRASFYMKRHQYKQASADYTAAVVADPSEYFLFQGRAEARRALGDLAGAAKDLNTAVGMFRYATDAASRSVLAKLLLESAQVLLDMGDTAGAANKIATALSIVPSSDYSTKAQLQQLLSRTGR